MSDFNNNITDSVTDVINPVTDTTETEQEYTGRRFVSIEDFRSSASPQDVEDLYHTWITSKNKSKTFKHNPKYGFSATSARTELIRRKKIKGNDEADTTSENSPELNRFIIDLSAKPDFSSRTITAPNYIFKAFDNMAEKYWQLSKKALMANVLDAGLRSFGWDPKDFMQEETDDSQNASEHE